jgi:hypothetical protein
LWAKWRNVRGDQVDGVHGSRAFGALTFGPFGWNKVNERSEAQRQYQ